MKAMSAILVLALLTPAISEACNYDTDCQPGSRCAKPDGFDYGICIGGLYPGNSYDSAPVRSASDPDNTFGNTCSYDADCGRESTCVKASGAIYGVCM